MPSVRSSKSSKIWKLPPLKNPGKIRVVGICILGIVYQKSGKVWAPNISGWNHFPLREKIRRHIRLPLVPDSDRSAYVLGEQWCGVAKGQKDVVFLAVGTGIGAGIIIDGRLCRESQDIAGAVGWFALNPNFKKEYAEMGCFEAEASGNSVGRKAAELLEAGELSVMSEMAGGEFDGGGCNNCHGTRRRNRLYSCKEKKLPPTFVSPNVPDVPKGHIDKVFQVPSRSTNKAFP